MAKYKDLVARDATVLNYRARVAKDILYDTYTPVIHSSLSTLDSVLNFQ